MGNELVCDGDHVSRDGGALYNPKKSVGLLVAVSLSVNVLSLALPIAMLHFYDRILPGHNISTMVVLVVSVCIAVVIEGVLKSVRSYMLLWSSAFFEHDVALRSMESFIHADFNRVSSLGSGEYIRKINTIGKLKDFYSGYLVQNFVDMVFVFIFLGVIYYLAEMLVLVPVLMILLCVLALIVVGRRLHRYLGDKEDCDNKRYNFIIEVLSGIHTVKSLGLESVFAHKYEKLASDATVAGFKPSLITSFINSYSVLFNQLTIAAVVFFGALMAIQGTMSMGTLIAVVLLTGRTIPGIQRMLMVWFKWHDFKLARENIKYFLSLPRLVKGGANVDEGSLGRLLVEDVSFGYGEESTLIDHLNIDVEAYSTISISGGYGCGKTTLLKLFAGLLVPKSGTVLINGVCAHNYSDEELCRYVAYMSSDINIFKGTIKENLTSFRGDELEERAMEIAHMLKIDQEVVKLPDGYDTMLNDTNADPISPGLKQRIAIARVLVWKPKLLLFDNADKSLDKVGYECVVGLLGLLKGKATIIIVSDDRNMLGFADKEYVLEGGKLKQNSFEGDSKFYDLHSNKVFKL